MYLCLSPIDFVTCNNPTLIRSETCSTHLPRSLCAVRNGNKEVSVYISMMIKKKKIILYYSQPHVECVEWVIRLGLKTNFLIFRARCHWWFVYYDAYSCAIDPLLRVCWSNDPFRCVSFTISTEPIEQQVYSAIAAPNFIIIVCNIITDFH